MPMKLKTIDIYDLELLNNMSFKHFSRFKRQNRDTGFIFRVIVVHLICKRAQLSVELSLIY